MLYIYSSNVKEGRLREYQEWIRTNLDRIHKEAPQGWKLDGVYFPVFGFGTHLSEIHWTIHNYAAFDEAHKTCLKEEGYNRLVEEWYDYLDTSSQSSRLLKLAQDPSTLVKAV
jgi:hypothetical protein